MPEAVASDVTTAWTQRRRRAHELIERYPHAAEQLRLYEALLDIQEPAFYEALDARPPAGSLPDYVADRVLPRVVDCSIAHGPSAMAGTVLERWRQSGGAELVTAWLRGADLDPMSRYLAHASTGPVLEALGPAAGLRPPGADDGRRCPTCGGLPQVSYVPASDETLVTPPRHLVCARCQHSWIFARMTCAGCGEESGPKLPIYGESDRLPHLRIDACDSCNRYLVTVDLRKDPEAVAIVDELAAVPLDLYARDQGKRKIVPNLMGM